MGFGRRRFSRRRPGISEVLGALLLIIVVVAAVASLAYFIAETEKAAQARNTYLTSVANENLQVPYAQFSPGSPSVQWELDCSTPGCSANYYVQIASASELILKQMDTPNAPITISNLVYGHFLNMTAKSASSAFIHDGATAQLTPANFSIDFAYTNYVFKPATWSNLTINILNENTQASFLDQVQVNNNWLPAWEEVDQTGQAIGPPSSAMFGPRIPNSSNPGQIYSRVLDIPAKSSVNLNLSLAGFDIAKNDSVKLTLLTGAGNFFVTMYSPPVPVILSSAASENYQIVTRDIVTFDGSHSVASDGAAEAYLWEFKVPTVKAGCSVGSFANATDVDVGFATGETVQYYPESIFSTAQLDKDCITGPIMASLVVADDNGLTTTSQPVTIASDPNIAPIASITGTNGTSNPDTVTITVQDIFGRNVGGVVVTAITYSGNVSTPSAETTNATGQAVFSVSWPTGEKGAGSVQFTVGALPPLRMSF